MRRALSGLTLLIGLLLVAPAPALAGGGSFMEWSALAYAPGQIASGNGPVYDTSCCGRGALADGPYFAYLVSAREPSGVTAIPKAAIKVAPVSITGRGPRWETTVSFTVPEVPFGPYYVHLCNDPCTKILGDSMGNGFTIVSSPERAEVQPMIQSLRRKTANQIATMRDRIGTLEAQYRALKRSTDTRIDLLSERVDGVEQAPKPEEDRPPTDPAAGVVLGALGIGALAWFVRRPR